MRCPYGPDRASALYRRCNRPARSFAKSPAKLNRSFSDWRSDRSGSKATLQPEKLAPVFEQRNGVRAAAVIREQIPPHL